jgi:hypothetical protein
VDVRGEPFLGFDGGEVLQVVAEAAAQVLDEPVEQRGEGQGVPGGAVILIRVRVGGCSVLSDPAVRRAGQRDQQGRTEDLAVRGGVGLADRAGADPAAGQVGSVLAAAGGAVAACRLGRGGLAADTGIGDLVVQFGDQLVKVGWVASGCGGLVAGLLGLGPLGDPPLLVLGSRVRLEIRLVLEVPAFLALRHPQRLSPLGTSRAHRREGVPAGDKHCVGLAGVQVAAAQLDRADARAVLDGQVADNLSGQRHGQPLRPGGLAGRGGHGSALPESEHRARGQDAPEPLVLRVVDRAAVQLGLQGRRVLLVLGEQPL